MDMLKSWVELRLRQLEHFLLIIQHALNKLNDHYLISLSRPAQGSEWQNLREAQWCLRPACVSAQSDQSHRWTMLTTYVFPTQEVSCACGFLLQISSSWCLHNKYTTKDNYIFVAHDMPLCYILSLVLCLCHFVLKSDMYKVLNVDPFIIIDFIIITLVRLWNKHPDKLHRM